MQQVLERSPYTMSNYFTKGHEKISIQNHYNTAMMPYLLEIKRIVDMLVNYPNIEEAEKTIAYCLPAFVAVMVQAENTIVNDPVCLRYYKKHKKEYASSIPDPLLEKITFLAKMHEDFFSMRGSIKQEHMVGALVKDSLMMELKYYTFWLMLYCCLSAKDLYKSEIFKRLMESTINSYREIYLQIQKEYPILSDKVTMDAIVNREKYRSKNQEVPGTKSMEEVFSKLGIE